MPDVIIKGMEMPESCYCCRANNSVYCFAVPDDADDVVGPYYRARSGKPDWCPLRPVSGWIGVEERLPETNGRYIVAYEDATSVLDFFNGKWFFPWHSSPGCIAWEQEGTIQAWMPFPELPEVNE